AQVMAALAPVEARPAERSPLLRGVRGVDAERRQRLGTGVGEEEAAGAIGQPPARDEPVEGEHAELAGEVVVADARLAQRRLARPGDEPDRAGAKGHAHQRLEETGDVAAGE